MESLKKIRPGGHELFLIAAIVAIILVVAAHSVFSQIRIGGLTIGVPKRPDIAKQDTPGGNKEQTADDRSGTTTTAGSDEPTFLNGMVYEITETRNEVEGYTPEGKIYLVSTSKAPWLLRAVSAKAREAHAVDKKFNDWRKANPGNKYDAELDTLAAVAARKLPLYIPKASSFALRDASIEQTIKGKLKNAATVKIMKTGVLHSFWQIETNSIGIPTNRYREAFVWGKDSADDHPFCHVYGFVIQQDYAGGGRYGASFTYLNTDVLFGCPASSGSAANGGK